MSKRMTSGIIAILLGFALSGCASYYAAKEIDNSVAKKDHITMFKAYEADDEHKDKGVNKSLEDYFTANRESVEESIALVINDRSQSDKAAGGAAKTAGFLKSNATLPAIENRILNEDEWFVRFRCSSAILDINNPSSRPTVIKAMEKETSPYTVSFLAKYLQSNPVPDSMPLLSKKSGEMVKGAKEDPSQKAFYLLAFSNLSSAKEALKKQSEGGEKKTR